VEEGQDHFLSADPDPVRAGDIFKLNRYAYVEGNPITGIDPNGRYKENLSGSQISCEIYEHNGCGTSSEGGGGEGNGASGIGTGEQNQVGSNGQGGGLVAPLRTMEYRLLTMKRKQRRRNSKI
jgi:hypothetical protein